MGNKFWNDSFDLPVDLDDTNWCQIQFTHLRFVLRDDLRDTHGCQILNCLHSLDVPVDPDGTNWSQIPHRLSLEQYSSKVYAWHRNTARREYAIKQFGVILGRMQLFATEGELARGLALVTEGWHPLILYPPQVICSWRADP
jgi:hypothetical protein